jgi:coenzyme F420 hydrogenase subunit beta
MTQILGSKELMAQVRNKDLCTACGGCVGLCPYHKAYKGKIAMTFDCDMAEGRCYAHCPKTETDFEALSQRLFESEYKGTPLGTYRRITAAKAGPKMAGDRFQNGGTVSALMTLALENSLIDAAVLTGKDGIVPEPKIVTEAADVVKCASTKYMAAPTVACLNEGAGQGYTNMGIVGTPCQLTAVAQMRLNPLNKADFKDITALTVGIFCTWALDTRKFLDFLKQRVDTQKITSMDVPPPPAEIFVVKTADETIEIPLDEIRAMVPNGCSICPDMTAEWSDLSVGAFEGKPGWNVLVVRTEKGGKLVDQAVEAGYLVLDDFPEESLQHLNLGAGNKKKRAQENAERMDS